MDASQMPSRTASMPALSASRLSWKATLSTTMVDRSATYLTLEIVRSALTGRSAALRIVATI